jgi:hypothetical protein
MTTTEDRPIATPEERQSTIETYGLGHVTLGDKPGALDEILQIIFGELLAMRHEIRTERLVVVHPDDGRELIHSEVLGGSVSLNVQFYDHDHGHHSSASLVSCDDDEGEAHVSLAVQDEIVAMISATTQSNTYDSAIAGDLMLQTETRRLVDGKVREFLRMETMKLDTTGAELEHAGGQVSAARFELQMAERS